jgi:hypothetical protein
MSIYDIASKAMKIKERLITTRKKDSQGEFIQKSLIITYPNSALRKDLRNHRFKVVCSSCSISEDKLRNNSDIYTEDSITFLLLYENLDDVVAIKDSSLLIPLKDYKKNSITINYDGKKYQVREEEKSSADIGVFLHCSNKD